MTTYEIDTCLAGEAWKEGVEVFDNPNDAVSYAMAIENDYLAVRVWEVIDGVPGTRIFE